MTSVPYCILLLFYSHHQVQSASSVGTEIGAALEEEDQCNATTIDELSETKDLVRKVNSRLNDSEVYLEELRKELSKNRDSTEAALARLEKQHLERDQQIQVALSEIKAGNSRRQTDSGGSGLGPRDCSDIRAMDFTTSGVYRIYAGDDRKRVPADVYCDFNRFKESWLVFQRRMDGSVNFDRSYAQYENGFGNLSGEFWLGNELIHLITTNRKYKLRIDLEDFEGEKRYAEYSPFVVNSRADFYRLTVGGYFGNAGNSILQHNTSRFTTLDMDNDSYKPANCAKLYHGGWWYFDCHRANLNGLYLRGNHTSYADGIEWAHWHGLYYSLKKTEMKLMRLEEKAV